MVRYPPDFTPGATYFFTATLHDRRATTLVDHIDLLIEAIAATRERRPFRCLALVVLPDHLHAIWRLPEGDADYPGRWRSIKSGFVRRLRKAGSAPSSDVQRPARIWQSRYWEHRIRDGRDLEAHVDYVHYNPVKHGHASAPEAWPHSTVHAWIRAGRLSPGWGTTPVEPAGQFGE